MWAATVTAPRPVEESLALLDLTDRADVRMRGLSGGEHRRVDIACALMGRPEVVMLDEPTTGLDPESRRAVWELVRDLRQQGATVLLTTHYLDEVEALADRVSIMRAGEVVREGTVAEIVADHPSQISFRTPDRALPLPEADRDQDGELTVLRVADLQPALTELLVSARDRGVVLDRLSARTASLESVFLDVAAERDGAAPHAEHHPHQPEHQNDAALEDVDDDHDHRPATDPTATARHAGLRRTLSLGRSNWTLMVRNRTTMLYAFALPLFPLVLLFTAERSGGDVNAGVAAIGTTLVMALTFPGYYNLLSMFVTRRDELVLKRLRTGEVRDRELLTSMALPGAAIVLAVAVICVPVALAGGLELPLNPVLLLLGVLLSVVTFAAFALWTAAWTRNAEAAQLTSGPVILLAFLGFMLPVFPEDLHRWIELLPGAAVNELLRVAWFGQESGGGSLSFLETWGAAGQPVLVLVAWTALAVLLARRSLRWEPRA